MSNLMTTTAVLAVLTIGSTAHAQDFYASVVAGYSVGDVTLSGESGGGSIDLDFEGESGYAIGVIVGTTVAPGIRAEAEVSYAQYVVDTISYDTSDGYSGSLDISDPGGETTVTYLLANVWYDIPNVGGGSGITPYIGGGLGLGMLTGEIDGASLFDDGSGLAFQLGGGVQVPVGPGAIDFGYRYKAITGAESGGFPLAPSLDELSSASSSFQASYLFTF